MSNYSVFSGKKVWILFTLLVITQAVIKNNFAKFPDYNWDIFPYMSIVLKMDGVSNDSLRHKMVYDHAKNTMPESAFEKNTDPAYRFRRAMSEDYKAFNEQLSLYSIKPLYLAIVYGLYKSGVDMLKATYIPSIIAFYLLGWLLFFFVAHRLNPWWGLIIAVLFTILPSNLIVVGLSSPDGLSAVILAGALVVILNNPKSRWIVVLLIMAILARRDNILFATLLYGCFLLRYYADKRELIMKVGELIVLLTAYFLIGWYSGNPGWKDTFMHSFAYKQEYFMSAEHPFSWELYWDILSRVFKRFSNNLWTYVLMGSLMIFLPGKGEKFIWKLTFHQTLFLIIIIVNQARFFLFPDVHERFFLVYYALIILLSVDNLSKREARLNAV